MNNELFRMLCQDRLKNLEKYLLERKIWIYGAGNGGRIAHDVLKKMGYSVEGFADRNADAIGNMGELPVNRPEKLNPKNDFVIIALMNWDYRATIMLYQIGFGVNDYMTVAYADFAVEDRRIEDVLVGKYTYGAESLINTWGLLIASIGRYCSINETARVWPQHQTNGVSSFPFFMPAQCESVSPEPEWYRTHWRKTISIGNDVWIGANVVILPNITIGDGAVIGANAIVNRDVEPYAVVGGVPARLIKYRFSEEIRKAMLRIKWWNWDTNLIATRLSDFRDVKGFIEKYDIK